MFKVLSLALTKFLGTFAPIVVGTALATCLAGKAGRRNLARARSLLIQIYYTIKSLIFQRCLLNFAQLHRIHQ